MIFVNLVAGLFGLGFFLFIYLFLEFGFLDLESSWEEGGKSVLPLGDLSDIYLGYMVVGNFLRVNPFFVFKSNLFWNLKIFVFQRKGSGIRIVRMLKVFLV